ncbi:MAG: type II toxin-antitoxin system RelE/ParE family toxin [Ignavibacteriae bacterium]|nr:type II toxin-antitoxin system RelE/ParE family toxin [Ignavibacteria bacterium]MBI3363786.1 type II toxin-antitoxin system RelE/ParE family toxin [Ignavibacteriota bacterium]
MSYRVIIPKSVSRELDKLPEDFLPRVLSCLTHLGRDPRLPGTAKLSGREAWRARVGDYRIIYEIHDKEKLVLVMKVRHRREIYR